MNISAFKTEKITPRSTTLEHLLDSYVPEIHERSVLVITSKIVSLCEERVIQKNHAEKKRFRAPGS